MNKDTMSKFATFKLSKAMFLGETEKEYKYRPYNFALGSSVYAKNLYYAWKEIKRRHLIFHDVQQVFYIYEIKEF